MSRFFESFCTRELAKIRTSSLFLSIHHYENEFSEVSNFSIVFHVNYLESVRKSQQVIKSYKPNFKDCEGKRFSLVDLETAKKELLSSYAMTLNGLNPLYTCIGVYDQVLDIDGKIIPGIKLHKQDDILHLEGYRVHKKVLRKGTYPIVNSIPLTLAKDTLRSRTPLFNWGQFKLVPGRFSHIVVDRINITDNDVTRHVNRM